MELSEENKSKGTSRVIRLFGDSLTAGTGGGGQNIETYLRNSLKDRLIVNYGIGGQTAEQIAARQGGLPLHISISGGAFNNATELSVTSLKSIVNGSIITNNFLSTAADTTDRWMSGFVKGVRCLIKCNGTTEAYTIIPYPNSTSIIDDNTIFYPDDAYNAKHDIQILWLGRNNLDLSTLSTVPSIVESCVNSIPSPKRVLILGVLSATADSPSSVTQINTVNDILRTAYTDNYVEMTAPTSEEILEIIYTLQVGDQTQINAGLFPTGMRADPVHLNQYGYNIIANRIIKKLRELNY